MAWKNIKQRSFADDLVTTHSAVEELDDVHDLIDWSRIGNTLEPYTHQSTRRKSMASVNDVQSTPSPSLVWFK